MKTDIYQALIDWNPWWGGDFPLELMGYKRDYDLLLYLEVPEVKIIEGARRVGKSTLFYQLIHHLFSQTKKNILYVNFEDEILKKYSLAEIIEAYIEYGEVEYLFVDEIQNCSDWVAFVRKTYDRHELKQIWVSGSNSSLIKAEYATLLTGRNLAIHVYPLSFREFLTFKSFSITFPVAKKQARELRQLFTEYKDHGAFPAVVTRNVLKKELLLAYFDDFIFKDIVSRYNVNASKIKELALYLATSSAKIFSYRSIASALNCHVNTIMDYFDYLKSAFLFEELYKFDYSLKKQIANDKKIYCLDVGLAAAVSFRFSEDNGRMLENIVFGELRRRQKDIFFHKQKYECDFVVKQDLQIREAIQVCVTLENPETKERELNGLLDALKTHQLKQGLIITYDEEDKIEVTNDDVNYTIFIKPIWRWMLHLD